MLVKQLYVLSINMSTKYTSARCEAGLSDNQPAARRHAGRRYATLHPQFVYAHRSCFMKTTPVTVDDLRRSVIAVPPLARNADLSLNAQANTALLRHLEQGGVRSVMYGGNANFYNVAVSEYARIIDFLAEQAGPDTWVLPSAGPDYGKLMDQAAILEIA